MKIGLLDFRLWIVLALAISPMTASAHDYAKGDLVVDHPWARPSFSAQAPAAVYFEIINNGSADDRLTSATTERAEFVELHVTEMDENGVSTMRTLKDGVRAPAGETTSLEHGAYHVMLIGLDRKLETGESFPMILTFEKAGPVEVLIMVEDREAGGAADHAHH